MTIEIVQREEKWAVRLTPEFVVAGFSSSEEAGSWVANYLARILGEKLSEDNRKQLAGAALLAVPEMKS